jgi:hypothetical protein
MLVFSTYKVILYVNIFSLIFSSLSHCHYFHPFLGFIGKNGQKSLNSMVNGTMSLYTYVDNWNYIHMMCVDKQNNMCLRQLVTY